MLVRDKYVGLIDGKPGPQITIQAAIASLTAQPLPLGDISQVLRLGAVLCIGMSMKSCLAFVQYAPPLQILLKVLAQIH